jgi:excinuclease ABC subunit A
VKLIEGLENLDKVIDIDQSPIGRTPRSNPATYTGVMTPVRELLARLPESRARGYKPGRFSFNIKGGRCETCEGDGVIRIAMHFLPDIYVTCERCLGKRYNEETLDIRYKGKNIAEILAMTVEEALEFFQNVPPIQNRLQTIVDVGLGYLTLGQSSVTLSGGEAQRVKLAKELSRRSTGKTLYILDEPTTGLHPADIQYLLRVLGRLVDAGNTVVVIEHNLDVIKTADYVIDIGPEGGSGGGRIIATGTPEEIARHSDSYTGMFLKQFLGND